MKHIPYETIWVDHPDIAAKAKAVGARPARTNADGSQDYTVPFVVITHVNSPDPLVLSDSRAINEYLDATYPDPSAPLFPPSMRVLDSICSQFLSTNVFPAVYRATVPAIAASLPERAQKFYKDACVNTYGFSFSSLECEDPMFRHKTLPALQRALDLLATHMDAGGIGNHRLLGLEAKVTHAELELVSVLFLARIADGADGGAWEAIRDRNEGRWTELLNVPEYKVLERVQQ